MVNSLSCCCLMSKILNHSRRFRVLSRTGVTTVNTRSVMASCNGHAGVVAALPDFSNCIHKSRSGRHCRFSALSSTVRKFHKAANPAVSTVPLGPVRLEYRCWCDFRPSGCDWRAVFRSIARVPSKSALRGAVPAPVVLRPITVDSDGIWIDPVPAVRARSVVIPRIASS